MRRMSRIWPRIRGQHRALVAALVGVVAEAGGHQRPGRSVSSEHADRLVRCGSRRRRGRPGSGRRGQHVDDDPGHDGPARARPRSRRRPRVAVHVVGRAVERVDDPATPDVPAWSAPSSPRIPSSGRAASSAPTMSCSAARSISVTRSVPLDLVRHRGPVRLERAGQQLRPRRPAGETRPGRPARSRSTRGAVDRPVDGVRSRRSISARMPRTDGSAATVRAVASARSARRGHARAGARGLRPSRRPRGVVRGHAGPLGRRGGRGAPGGRARAGDKGSHDPASIRRSWPPRGPTRPTPPRPCSVWPATRTSVCPTARSRTTWICAGPWWPGSAHVPAGCGGVAATRRPCSSAAAT